MLENGFLGEALKKISGEIDPEKIVFSNENGAYSFKNIISEAIGLSKIILGKLRNNSNLYVGLIFDDTKALLIGLWACIIAGKVPVFLSRENKNFEDFSLILTDDHISGSEKFLNTGSLTIQRGSDLDISNKGTDEGLVILTSGTTSGASKKVILSEKNLQWTSEQYSKIYGLTHQTVIGSTLPPHYSFPVVAGMVSSLVNGAQFVAINDHDNYIKTLYYLLNHKVNILLGNPNSLLQIALNSQFGLPDLRLCDSGGVPLSQKTRQIFRNKLGIVISEGYGLTETSTLTHFRKNIDNTSFPGYVGMKLPGVRTHMKPLFHGKKIGILLVSGEMVTPGYIGKEHSLEAIFSPDTRKIESYYNTEDVVLEKDNGELFYIGRFRDVYGIPFNDLMKLVKFREIVYQIHGVQEMTFNKGNEGKYFCFIGIGEHIPESIYFQVEKQAEALGLGGKANLLLLDKIPKNINGKPSITSLLSKI